jgi:hypothetical protein
MAVLFLMVWMLYVVDRVLDAQGSRRLLQERHRFHWEHRRVLIPLVVVVAGCVAYLIGSRLPGATLGRDAAVGMATIGYFSVVHWRSRTAPWVRRVLSRVGTREVMVGAIFSAGCVIAALGSEESGVNFAAVLAPAVGFAVLAWLNVRAIGEWEECPAGHVCRMAFAVSASGLGLAVCIAWFQPRSALLLAAVAVSALLLAGLDLRRDSFSPVALRAAADLVLLTPLLIVPFAVVMA